MLRDFLLWIAGSGVALLLMAASLLFPDAPRNVLWGCFVVGLIAAVVALAIIPALSFREAENRRGGVLSIIGMAFFGLGFVGCLAWFLWPSDIFDKKMAGFTVYSVVRMYDSPELRRKYLFEFGDPQGARVSFYLSASDIFTLNTTDVHNEPYSLEVKLGHDGVPIDQVIALFCEVALTEGSIVLRVVVNGREVKRRNIEALSINLGDINWEKKSLGADIGGKDNGILLFFELGVYPFTLTNEEIRKLVANIREYMKLPFK